MLFLFSLISFGISPLTLAHDVLQKVHVVSFAPAGKADRHTIVFDAETTNYGDLTNLPLKKRRFIIRLRCEPRFSTMDQYRAAIQLLQRCIAESPDITIARMSSKGWRPVSGQRGIFESVGLRIQEPPKDHNGPPVILFLHDDRF